MPFPVEIYERILFCLPLRDLLNAACVSRLFYTIVRWCLTNEDYIQPWTLSFRENNGAPRLLPLDLKQTKDGYRSSGMYVFMAKIKPIYWCQEVHHYFQASNSNVIAIPFKLRFLDFDDLCNMGEVEGYSHLVHC